MLTTGEKIRAAREAAGITQDELGKLCGVAKQTIFKYESGIITNIPLDKVKQISNILSVSPIWLLGWDEMSRTEALLSALEDSMLSKFRSLNADGQSKVISYTDDLIRAGIYKNIPESDPVSKDA